MSNDNMREKFEFFYGLPFDECDVFMRKSWEAAWKASRESLVIELPASLPLEGRPFARYEGGWNDMREESIDALAAIGLKVKP